MAMLKSSDMQIFSKLIDTLEGSIRTLSTKYELMERNTANLSGSYIEMKSYLDDISRNMEDVLRHFSEIELKYSNQASLAERCSSKLDTMGTNLETIRQNCTGGCQFMRGLQHTLNHLDGHADSDAEALGMINGTIHNFGEIKKVVENMHKDLSPLARLVSTMKKPIAIAFFIYLLFASLAAISKTSEWVGKLYNKMTHQQESGSFITHGSP